MLRLAYTINLVKTKDYTYVKMQGEMWAFAEIAFGLACSCFPILPRLYQHISAVTPYTAGTIEEGTARDHARTLRRANGERERKQKEKEATWIHLDDGHGKGWRKKSQDEELLDSAVEGSNDMMGRNTNGC